MAKRRGENRFLFLIMAPFVVAVAGLGIWVSVLAVMENVRLWRFSNEVMSIVRLARDMSKDFQTNDEHATRVLFERLAQTGSFDLVAPTDPTQRGIVNAWGAVGTVGLLLSQQEVRLRTTVSPTICRRFLFLQAPSVEASKIARIEARDEGSMGTGRLIYSSPANGPQIDQRWIEVGCGSAEKVALSMTFRLK